MKYLNILLINHLLFVEIHLIFVREFYEVFQFVSDIVYLIMIIHFYEIIVIVQSNSIR